MNDRKAPERIFALPYHEIGGKSGLWTASPHTNLGATEYALLSAVQADPAKFGVVPAVSLDDEDGLLIAYLNGVEAGKKDSRNAAVLSLLKRGDTFPHRASGTDVTIMAVQDGYVMARLDNCEPRIYSLKEVNNLIKELKE